MPSTSDRDSRDYTLFVIATVLMGLSACVNSSMFNNYLKDVFALDVSRRTFLEFPRELPGFLVSILVASLAMLGEVRTAMVANLAMSAGFLALGWIPSSFVLMLSSLFVYSAGQHVYMPMGNAIGMSFAAKGREGSILGRLSSINNAALLACAVVLLALIRFAGLSYRAAFTAGAFLNLAAALTLLAMSPRRAQGRPARLVFKRRYLRYYGLSVLYGMRKQLFITFGPWMLVDLFKAPVELMTLLFLLTTLIGIGATPLVGRLTDRLGIRRVLGGEALIMVAVCFAYAFAPELLPAGAALVVVACCYVTDLSANAVTMTRAIYVRQIAEESADVSPTLSLGISIDHVMSMAIPTLGSLAWLASGGHAYRWVFLGGAAVAAVNFALTRGIKTG